jgi:hypothetical protein
MKTIISVRRKGWRSQLLLEYLEVGFCGLYIHAARSVHNTIALAQHPHLKGQALGHSRSIQPPEVAQCGVVREEFANDRGCRTNHENPGPIMKKLMS